MKEVVIQGFTSDTRPTDKPCLAVYGLENVGKTRFACTAPCSDGVLAFLALDKNTKRIVDDYKKSTGANIMVNKTQYITDKQAIELMQTETKSLEGNKLTEGIKKVRQIYTDALNRVADDIDRLVTSRDVESIAIDQNNLLFDWILFSHFGRKNQIESFSRAAPNQDMIDIINTLRNKNSVLVHRAADIYKEEVDQHGNKKSSPTGRVKPEGFSKLGYLVTGVFELSSKKLTATESDLNHKDRDEILNTKYRIKVVSCKGNTLLEGRDLEEYGVCGEAIGWDQVLMAIGVEG